MTAPSVSPSGDGALLSALFAQLGYPTPGEEVDGRLAEPDPAREVLVACHRGDMVGVLVWHRLQPAPCTSLGPGSRRWLSMRVQGEAASVPGCWRRAERRARDLGVLPAGALQQPQARGAHRFYLAQGCCERPKRFVKAV